ncbi:Uncharacterised protein [Mycobacterium tuberculosis]|nr:Uncharacterised protein [Mycobacterium tuberculosis]
MDATCAAAWESNGADGRFLPSTPCPMVRQPIPKEINEHMIIYSDMLAGWLFVNSLPPGAPQRRRWS